jgi:flagellar biosynthesis protein
MNGSPGESRPLAVALTYDGQGAPRVVAKGAGDVADRILATAREHRVPLQPDAELVRLLVRLELGDEIPRSLYVGVAHVLAFAWALSGKTPPPRRQGRDGDHEGAALVQVETARAAQ